MADLEYRSQEQRPLWLKTWTSAKAWLRRDGIVIALFVLASIVMTYPLAFQLDKQWLALRDTDTYVKIWDNWWLRNHAFSEPSLFFTGLQFYPNGLDLTFHSISWTVAFLAWPLAIITDVITAYNLTILIAIFTTAYAAYLLVMRFVRHRAAAWLAGAVYSFAPYHLAHSGGHPDLTQLAPIPIAVILLFSAVNQTSVLSALGAALMVGLAAFTSLYIMVFALLTIGPILLFLLLDKGRWRQREVWPVVAVFIIASAVFLTIRLAPILRDTSELAGAIELKYTANANQTDLLSYVLPSRLNPLYAPYTEKIASQFAYMSYHWPAYLGVVSVLLLLGALMWKERRRIVLVWFAAGLMFVILSLGPALRLNGNLYENIVLPARYLDWFPPIRAVGRPDFFVIGVLLPVGVLAAIGFDRLLTGMAGRRTLQITLMFAVPALLLADYWSGEFPGIPTSVSPFYEQLADEPDDFAIIQLPMGRNSSKHYLYLQTIHHKPIVEGLSARTLPETYEYIQSNPLLDSWFNDQPVDCDVQNRQQLAAQFDQLSDDGFRYVIVHHRDSKIPDQFAGYFVADPVYSDNILTAYRLADLRDQPPCQDIYRRVFDPPSPTNATSVSWEQKISLLGYDLGAIDRDSNALPITVYWQALSEMESSYTVYLHLIDTATNSLVAQADAIPRGWSYPTSWWMAGEVVDDTMLIPVENVSPGHYELYVGWYDASTGRRLPPESSQLELTSDNSALLTSLDF
jgi:hypothetical protein